MQKLVTGLDEPLRPDVLAGLGQLGGPLAAEQQPRAQGGDGHQRRAVQADRLHAAIVAGDETAARHVCRRTCRFPR
jgi:hypothetical protein